MLKPQLLGLDVVPGAARRYNPDLVISKRSKALKLSVPV